MKSILVSKRFHPGHISHIRANALLLQDIGFDVRFALNREFFKFTEELAFGERSKLSDYFNLKSGDLFIVWFPSFSVIFNMLFVRLTSSATVVYVHHEPYTSFKSYRSAGFSRSKALKVAAISLVNRVLCRLSHKIILPSARAFHALPEAKSNPARYAKINLLFADEVQPGQIDIPRVFVAYIGTVAEDHAFEEFVGLMHASILQHAFLPYRFLIATRSVMPERLAPVIEECLGSGRLTLHSGIPLTNSEINQFYAQSFVVWNAYKRSMQSGVLPKAYMFGTPVIVSEGNRSEYFQDGVHGAMISNQYFQGEFIEALEQIDKTWASLSGNCRSYYLDNFDYRALSAEFSTFVLDKR